MKLCRPFEWLSDFGQKRAFIAWAVLALVLMASLQVLGGPLKTDVAPMGIVSFELAGEISKAQRIIESWGEQGRVYAGLNLGLDYLFILSYASAISLGCVLVSRRTGKQAAFVGWVGIALSWGLWLAALLDVMENLALTRVLLGSVEEGYPVLARWCAIPKFLLVGVGLVYILLGAAMAVGWRTHPLTNGD